MTLTITVTINVSITIASVLVIKAIKNVVNTAIRMLLRWQLLLLLLEGDRQRKRRRGLPYLHLVLVYCLVHATDDKRLLISQKGDARRLELNRCARLHLPVLQLNHLE
jgi:hypothetical protein